MLSKSQKRVVLGAAILVFAVLFLVPSINIKRYKDTVAESLTRALGRSVTIQDISLQTFPQPGLLLKGVVVADDPSISAEPMLRDDEEVLATLRFTSLWRGRLEISSLKFKYPSLNLVRANDGRWNIESVLERVRQTPAAPTVNKRPEARTRFPYIEAKDGRINLKLGQEKKVFALGEADFALWAPGEDEWRMRLEARPIRTDANLSDTGTIKVEGSWRRAGQLRDTPVNFRFWWEDGQLGQLTRLIQGHDRGWRGSVRISGLVLGTPENLKIVTDARLDDFRRYDIATDESLSIQTHCDAFYSLSQRLFHDLYCQSPMGGGVAIARGSISTASNPRQIDLSFSAENVSAQFLTALARHSKKNIPADLAASGTATAVLTVHSTPEDGRIWAGNGSTSTLQLRSSVLGEPLEIGPTRWRLAGPGTEQFAAVKSRRLHPQQVQQNIETPDKPAFVLDSVSVPLGGASAATLRGWFTSNRVFAEVKGTAEIERAFRVAKAFGLPTASADVTGTAEGTFILAGEFRQGQSPDYIADAQLQNVKAKISGVASPMTIRSAHFAAEKNSFELSKAIASFAGVRSQITFNASWNRGCPGSGNSAEAGCGIRFDASADQVNVDDINSLLNPKAQRRPWYAALANTVLGSEKRSFPDVRAIGNVNIGSLLVKGVPAARFAGNLQFSPDGFTLTNATADVFGGKYHGEISSDFRGRTPVYSSKGRLQGVALSAVAVWMRDAWATGKASFTYEGKAAGWSADELLASAAGGATFEWRDGTLNHIELDSAGKPLQFHVFTGVAELSDGQLTISQSKLQARKGIYQVSGTASPGRVLEFKLARDGAPGFSISGSLEKPKVEPLKVPQTQASLR